MYKHSEQLNAIYLTIITGPNVQYATGSLQMAKQ